MANRQAPATHQPSGHRRSDALGVEFAILTRLPMLFAATLVIPLVFVLLAHLMPGAGTAGEIARHTMMANVLALAAWLTSWSLLFALTIGCLAVHIMKGPAIVADSYPLATPDADGSSQENG